MSIERETAAEYCNFGVTRACFSWWLEKGGHERRSASEGFRRGVLAWPRVISRDVSPLQRPPAQIVSVASAPPQLFYRVKQHGKIAGARSMLITQITSSHACLLFSHASPRFWFVLAKRDRNTANMNINGRRMCALARGMVTFLLEIVTPDRGSDAGSTLVLDEAFDCLLLVD